MGKKCHERFWPQVSQIKLLTRFVSLQKKYSWLYKVRCNAVSRHEVTSSKIPFSLFANLQESGKKWSRHLHHLELKLP